MIVPYTKDLHVTNIEQLPRGTGAKYLIAIRANNDVLIAKSWSRKLPKVIHPNEVIIRF